jgi:hypothetical protein
MSESNLHPTATTLSVFRSHNGRLPRLAQAARRRGRPRGLRNGAGELAKLFIRARRRFQSKWVRGEPSSVAALPLSGPEK